MGRRTPSVQSKALTGAGTAVFSFDIRKVTGIQVMANYAQGPSGTTLAAAITSVEVSNHPNAVKYTATGTGPSFNDVPPIWSTATGVTIAAITTGAQDEMIHVGNLGAQYMRITWTHTSGAGDIAVLVAGRD